MKSHRAPTTRRARPGTVSRSPLPWAAGVLVLVAVPVFAGGQVPPSQAPQALQQAVQQNPGLPDIIRQRILQSGLTPEQVRARLAASGYPSNLLDAYIGAAQAGQPVPTPGALELGAVQALGLFAIPGSQLPVDTGLVVRRVAAPDRKSTRLNSSHGYISYAVFCLKKKKKYVTQGDASRRI